MRIDDSPLTTGEKIMGVSSFLGIGCFIGLFFTTSYALAGFFILGYFVFLIMAVGGLVTHLVIKNRER